MIRLWCFMSVLILSVSLWAPVSRVLKDVNDDVHKDRFWWFQRFLPVLGGLMFTHHPIPAQIIRIFRLKWVSASITHWLMRKMRVFQAGFSGKSIKAWVTLSTNTTVKLWLLFLKNMVNFPVYKHLDLFILWKMLLFKKYSWFNTSQI